MPKFISTEHRRNWLASQRRSRLERIKREARPNVPHFLGRAPQITVEVTAKRINEGAKRNSNHCMVAESLKDSYPKLNYIAVDIQTIRATDRKKKERYIWLTPRSVQEMIINFDRGVKPLPFRFICQDGQTVPTQQRTTKAKLRRSRHGESNVPAVSGGRKPPRSVGYRRSFGLRSLKY